MKNQVENAVKEFIKSSSEEEKKGAKKALDLVQGFLSIASHLGDEIKVKDVKDFIGRVQGEL
jgi:hypothetical protein